VLNGAVELGVTSRDRSTPSSQFWKV